MGTKNNPGLHDCYNKAEDDEPMFVLLARDPVAPMVIKLWADLRTYLGIDNLNTNEGHAKLKEAFELAKAMECWKAKHPDHGH